MHFLPFKMLSGTFFAIMLLSFGPEVYQSPKKEGISILAMQKHKPVFRHLQAY
jgi:hypothetical protein